MTVIGTNIASLRASNASNSANKLLGTAMERLSTGKRINNAKDDAAGLAIASTMTAAIRGMNQAVRNANDGISLAQTAEWLRSLGRIANGFDVPDPGRDDVRDLLETTPSGFGALTGRYAATLNFHVSRKFTSVPEIDSNFCLNSSTVWICAS